jgi:hypothetical protein
VKGIKEKTGLLLLLVMHLTPRKFALLKIKGLFEWIKWQSTWLASMSPEFQSQYCKNK